MGLSITEHRDLAVLKRYTHLQAEKYKSQNIIAKFIGTVTMQGIGDITEKQ